MTTHLIWSNEGRLWWRANGAGYTGSIAEYAAVAREIADRAAVLAVEQPQLRLKRNDVGNLAILDGGEYVGFVDVRDGGVTMFADEPDPDR